MESEDPTASMTQSPVPVNLNKATKEELLQVNGVSEEIADVIIGLRGPGGELSLDSLIKETGVGKEVWSDMVERGDIDMILTDYDMYKSLAHKVYGSGVMEDAFTKMTMNIQQQMGTVLASQFQNFQQALNGRINTIDENLMTLETAVDGKIVQVVQTVSKLQADVQIMQGQQSRRVTKMEGELAQLKAAIANRGSGLTDVIGKDKTADWALFNPQSRSTPKMQGSPKTTLAQGGTGSDQDDGSQQVGSREKAVKAGSEETSQKSKRASRRGARSPHAVTRHNKRDRERADALLFGVASGKHRQRSPSSDSSSCRKTEGRKRNHHDKKSRRHKHRSESSDSDSSCDRSRHRRKKDKRRGRYSSSSSSSESSESSERTHRRKNKKQDRDRRKKKSNRSSKTEQLGHSRFVDHQQRL